MTDRSSQEIEQEIEQQRQHMGRTLDAIQERLSPGEIMDQVVDYFRSGRGEDITRGAGEFVSNLGRSIRDNPIPVALIGTGVCWLIFSGARRRGESWEGRQHHYDTQEDWDDDAWQAYRSGYGAQPGPGGLHEAAATGERSGAYGAQPGATGSPAGSPGDGSSMADRARSGAKDMADRASQWGAAARERTVGAAQATRERIASAGESFSHAGERLSEAGERFQRSARQSYDDTRRRTRRSGRGFSQVWREQPLVLGAVGLAIGALLGAALPRTQHEDEWLGEAADEVKQRAMDQGQEELSKARRVVEKAAHAASEAAEKEGIHPKAAEEGLKAAKDMPKDAVRSAGDRVVEAQQSAEAKARDAERKAREVGEAAKEAAKSEASRQNLGGGGQAKP
jgi:hypothetical protein